jgi:hypothetical protein
MLLLKIHFVEDLKVANVGNGVGTDVLRVKVVKVENIQEEFWPGRREVVEEVICKDDDFTFFRLRSSFSTWDSLVDGILRWQDSHIHKLLERQFKNLRSNPIAWSGSLGNDWRFKRLRPGGKNMADYNEGGKLPK